MMTGMKRPMTRPALIFYVGILYRDRYLKAVARGDDAWTCFWYARVILNDYHYNRARQSTVA
jgi:hypothetical protein